MSVIAFGCVLGGTFFGIFLRHRLPEHHLSAATKDVVRLGTGLNFKSDHIPVLSPSLKPS